MADQGPYDGSWRDLRWRRRLILFAWLGYIPGVVIINMMVEAVKYLFTGNPRTGEIVPFIVYAGMAFFAVSGLYGFSFRCPNCGRTWMGGWMGFAAILNSKCRHCGIQLKT